MSVAVSGRTSAPSPWQRVPGHIMAKCRCVASFPFSLRSHHGSSVPVALLHSSGPARRRAFASTWCRA
eukprot:4974468-Lingulodinium_polyedra.AAC.1